MSHTPKSGPIYLSPISLNWTLKPPFRVHVHARRLTSTVTRSCACQPTPRLPST